MKKLVPFALAATLLPGAALAPSLSSCNSGEGLLRAKIIENRSELIGGPVAMADVGDYLLENDQIRIAILGPRDSPAPGVFGGSIIDADRRRSRMGYEGGQGRDRFAETFPLANLIVPDATAMDIHVLDDGSSGEEARIRVEGDGQFLFEALAILRNRKEQLDLLYPNVRTHLRFRTDYVVRPGDRHVKLETTLFYTDEPPPSCAALVGCTLGCDYGYQQDAAGCPVCACSDRVDLDIASEPVNVFGKILGDSPGSVDPPAENRAGIVAGDFVFFGNQNDVFAPGPGFDEDSAVQTAANTGRNSFTKPLTFDFVAAAGGDVSYGYFTEGSGDAPAVVNVPIFASAATAFLAASKSCLLDSSDDDTCDKNRAFYYERYLVVGDGDVASVAEEMYRVRGTKTGTLRGQVLWETGEPAVNGHVFVFADPDEGRTFSSVSALADANRALRGDVGLLMAIDADLGEDRVQDGDFQGKLPPGSYLIVARNDEESATSKPERVTIQAGSETLAAPVLTLPATIDLRVTDEAGQYVPAKLTLITLDKKGASAEGDGLRKPYLGEGRLGSNGARFTDVTASGHGTFSVEPGRYKAIVSRGPEYGIFIDEAFEVASGAQHSIDALLAREVDTTGYLSADLHLHARTSFDSGMPLTKRVTTAAAEGLEVAIATDHDVETDYLPSVRELGLEPLLKTIVGGEITTLEQGHFIGFPLAYDELIVPTHGAYDWTCNTGEEILEGIRSGALPGSKVFTILAHPRDGFFGYNDQIGLDPYTGKRVPTLLEAENPVFRTATCSYDGMEILNGKRIDLIRTPTVREMVDWNRCRDAINKSQDKAALDTACPQISPWPPAPCAESEDVSVCRTRYRTKAAWLMDKRILERTPEEQAAEWSFSGTREDSKALCDDESFGLVEPDPATLDMPCAFRPGHVEDYFRFLERGMVRTQVASSDSHETAKEPGIPRTFIRSTTDSPMAAQTNDVTESLRGGHAFASYGPFVKATLDGKSYGDLVSSSEGKSLELLVEVQTASWFGVDRVEVYLNGELIRVIDSDAPKSAIVDVKGKVTFQVPARDSWIVVIAMGLKDENLLRPVSLDVPFGEVQLSKLASDAFGDIPGINALFTATPTVPDWSPVFPYAVTNAIFIDTNKNGRYDAPLPFPEYCSRPCDPNIPDADQCPEGQICLDGDKQCGLAVGGACDHRRVAVGPDR